MTFKRTPEETGHEAAEAAAAAADGEWMAMATGILRELADRGQPFTSEDVLLRLEHVGVRTGETRALGALFKSWSGRKRIRATGRWVAGTRAASHGRPMREWLGGSEHHYTLLSPRPSVSPPCPDISLDSGVCAGGHDGQGTVNGSVSAHGEPDSGPRKGADVPRETSQPTRGEEDV